VAAEHSELTGRHLWAIGVDSDRWFDVTDRERPHVLTSVIKRIDVAAFELARHMTSGGPTGLAVELDLANGGFAYSTQGGGLTPAMTTQLDAFVEDIGAGQIQVPIRPSGDLLLLDLDGNEISKPPATESPSAGVDGLEFGSQPTPGTHEIGALGTPLTVTIEPGWVTGANDPGHTAFSHPDASHVADRQVVFMRPQLLTDPSQPQAAVDAQIWWRLDDIEGWLDNLTDGIIVSNRSRVDMGGRETVFFEVEIADASACGRFGYCAGFIINHIFEDGDVSGWSFEHGFHHRVWWVDGGNEPPVVIIAATRSDDRSFQAQADELLSTLIIGEPEPHPVGDLLPGN